MLVRRRSVWREVLLTGYTVLLGSLLHFVYGWSGGSVLACRLFRRQRVYLGTHEAAVFPRVFADPRPNLYPAVCGRLHSRRAGNQRIHWPGADPHAVLYLYRHCGDPHPVGGHRRFHPAAAGTFAADSALTRSGRLRRPWQQIAGMLVLWALAFCFVWCTFRPPHLALWLDPVTGRYGL